MLDFNNYYFEQIKLIRRVDPALFIKKLKEDSFSSKILFFGFENNQLLVQLVAFSIVGFTIDAKVAEPDYRIVNTDGFYVGTMGHISAIENSLTKKMNGGIQILLSL
ncbi:hypothetical protein [Foetidibacter luteolus]|uniref:hypothetical protein n=1 Tax=Foetidibacter luteolus TaxID=2608880 RepID=UPI00129AFB11|nr:hypothetical protein [Foetidibacter luteolus]